MAVPPTALARSAKNAEASANVAAPVEPSTDTASLVPEIPPSPPPPVDPLVKAVRDDIEENEANRK